MCGRDLSPAEQARALLIIATDERAAFSEAFDRRRAIGASDKYVSSGGVSVTRSTIALPIETQIDPTDARR